MTDFDFLNVDDWRSCIRLIMQKKLTRICDDIENMEEELANLKRARDKLIAVGKEFSAASREA
jgi:hypothetical protein